MKLVVFAVFTLILSISGKAQIKPLEKAVIKTPALQCEECAMMIERYMIRQNGIRSIKTNYIKRTVSVSWLTDRIDLDDIRIKLSNLGFDADSVAAEPGAAKRLPACCRQLPAAPKN